MKSAVVFLSILLSQISVASNCFDLSGSNIKLKETLITNWKGWSFKNIQTMSGAIETVQPGTNKIIKIIPFSAFVSNSDVENVHITGFYAINDKSCDFTDISFGESLIVN